MVKRIVTICLLIAMAVGIYGYRIFDEIRIAINRNPNAITVWVPFSPQHEFTNSFEQLLMDWADTQDDIEIEFLAITFFDYFGKIRTAQSGGVGPDVSINDIVTLPFRAQNRHVLNLDPFIESGYIDIDNYFEADIERLSYRGSLYAVPFSIDARFLFFNKDHFRAAGLDPYNPPTTLEELQATARLLTLYENNTAGGLPLNIDTQGRSNRLYQLGFHPEWGNNHIAQFAWAQGGGIFADDATVDWYNPINYATMRWWVETSRIVPQPHINQFNGRSDKFMQGVNPFFTGAVSMIVENDPLAWEIETFFEQHPDRVFDWGVITIPYATCDETGVSFETSWSGVFTTEVAAGLSSEREAKAVRVMQFLISDTVQNHILDMFGWKPGTRSAIERVLADPDTSPQQRYILEKYEIRRHMDHNEAVPEWGFYLSGPIQNATAGRISVSEAMQLGEADLQNSINRHFGIISCANMDWFAIILVAVLLATVIVLYIGDMLLKRRKNKIAQKTDSKGGH